MIKSGPCVRDVQHDALVVFKHLKLGSWEYSPLQACLCMPEVRGACQSVLVKQL